MFLAGESYGLQCESSFFRFFFHKWLMKINRKKAKLLPIFFSYLVEQNLSLNLLKVVGTWPWMNVRKK